MMNRQDAVKLMESKVTNINLRKHILAVEAVMRQLARELKQDEAKWALTGLLHDLDYEDTKNSPERHALVTAELLRDTPSVTADIIDAIKAHADKKEKSSLMEHAIYCADPVTGFIVACALIHPDKKLAPIDVPFARNRMKEKRFAAGANRDAIQHCSALGFDLDKFLQISLDAMKSISPELEL
ncbi:MAG: HDIG domain-containing protein [Planctomycetes bacterium]|nr:HDIG domain-containing protein [Planctomycetota bacterium]